MIYTPESKTLYISDLDGTLLNNDVMLTDRTINILNSLIDNGLLFTVATARTIASVKYILKDLNLNLPIIMMNGVCIYDPVKEEYIRVEALNKEELRLLISVIEENHLKGFMYSINNQKLATYYEDIINKSQKDFFEERVVKYNKKFTRVDKFSMLMDEPVIYFSLMDYKEKLYDVHCLVEKLPNINSVFYKDNYSQDIWYLEIFSKQASKYHAVQFLRSYLSIDYVVGFGDNQNDMALYKACDKFYAVENAIEELKRKADGVIGRNTEDGVALWLKQNI